MCISLGLDVGAVSVKLAALGAPEHFPLFERRAADHPSFFIPQHPNGMRKVRADHPLAGKTVYIPDMADGSVEALCAVMRWMGIEARPTLPSDSRTMELGSQHTNGEECFPAKITTGDFLKLAQRPGFDAKRTVFFMGTSDGPCRLGQYAPFLRKVLREQGHGDVRVFSPRGEHGYSDFQDFDTAFIRWAWRAIVSADLLRKLLRRRDLTKPRLEKPTGHFGTRWMICAGRWNGVALIHRARCGRWGRRCCVGASDSIRYRRASTERALWSGSWAKSSAVSTSSAISN